MEGIAKNFKKMTDEQLNTELKSVCNQILKRSENPKQAEQEIIDEVLKLTGYQPAVNVIFGPGTNGNEMKMCQVMVNNPNTGSRISF